MVALDWWWSFEEITRACVYVNATSSFPNCESHHKSLEN